LKKGNIHNNSTQHPRRICCRPLSTSIPGHSCTLSALPCYTNLRHIYPLQCLAQRRHLRSQRALAQPSSTNRDTLTIFATLHSPARTASAYRVRLGPRESSHDASLFSSASSPKEQPESAAVRCGEGEAPIPQAGEDEELPVIHSTPSPRCVTAGCCGCCCTASWPQPAIQFRTTGPEALA